MSLSEIQGGKSPSRAASTLFLWAGVAMLAVSAAQARANDPDRGEDGAALAEEPLWVGPQGTAGTPAIRAQRDAFWDQVTARREQYLAGKISPDLLLEADRFCTQADHDCAAAPWQRVASSRAALKRARFIHAISSKKLAAGQIKPADMSQVDGQMKLFEVLLKQDIEAAQKAAENP